jgi:hypothetical protein
VSVTSLEKTPKGPGTEEKMENSQMHLYDVIKIRGNGGGGGGGGG